MAGSRPSWRAELAGCLRAPPVPGLPAAAARRAERVARIFPLRIPPHPLALMDPADARCPVRRQVIPDIRELDGAGRPDPLDEESFQVAPGLIRRFRDRLLALVSPTCPIHCRHCNRKRYWTRASPSAGPGDIARALEARPGIREVILSGGEPLLLADARIDRLLRAARTNTRVEIVRIHSRIPFSIPSRITPGLVRVLRRHRPLWFSTQFNHARELSAESRRALVTLRDAGIPVLNQAVLLRGVNDSVAALVDLGRLLVGSGVKPHYLFGLDRASGTVHFQVAPERALDLVARLRKDHSGLLVPHLLQDLPGRLGKQPICPGSITLAKTLGLG